MQMMTKREKRHPVTSISLTVNQIFVYMRIDIQQRVKVS